MGVASLPGSGEGLMALAFCNSKIVQSSSDEELGKNTNERECSPGSWQQRIEQYRESNQ